MSIEYRHWFIFWYIMLYGSFKDSYQWFYLCIMCRYIKSIDTCCRHKDLIVFNDNIKIIPFLEFGHTIQVLGFYVVDF